jgi:hypothetical protein
MRKSQSGSAHPEHVVDQSDCWTAYEKTSRVKRRSASCCRRTFNRGISTDSKEHHNNDFETISDSMPRSVRWLRLGASSELVDDLGMTVENAEQLAGRSTRLDESTLVLVEGVFADLEKSAGFALRELHLGSNPSDRRR